MSNEILKNNFKKSDVESSPKPKLAIFEETGCKVDRFAGRDIETNREIETDYELDPANILKRWEKVFGAKIQECGVEKETLSKMAEKFSQESKKMIDWLKNQPKPEQYEVVHFVNPHSGEHITIQKPGAAKRIYGVSARFESDGAKVEHSNSFSEE